MSQLSELYHHCDQFIRQQMAFYRIPALAFVFTDREKTLHSGYYGTADLEKKVPLNPDHVFNFGSIGKSFTSILLLKVQEEGLLDLQKPVRDYLPWFEVQSAYAPITLHHLLTHSSGLPMGTDQETESLGEVWNLRQVKTAYAPGEHFYYSNVGYKTLGLVLEKIYDKPYASLVQEKILDPLGMRDTFPAILNANRPRFVQAFAPLYDDRPFNRAYPLVPAHWLETSTADGCISSTPEDLARYARMLLNRGQFEGKNLFSEQSFELMTQPYMPFAENMVYAYGLMVHEGEGFNHLSHSGSIPGYVAFMDLDMDSGLGMVIHLVEPATASVRPFLFDSLRAVINGKDLPPMPDSLAVYKVENGQDYCGKYNSPARSFEVLQDGDYLWLDDGAEKNRLEPRGRDLFFIDHPDYSRFLLKFKKESEGGPVQDVFYGDEYFSRSGSNRKQAAGDLPDLEIYCGHYRSHNPWLNNFRIVQRRDQLLFIYPSGEELELVPDGENKFLLKTGDKGLLYEKLSFSAFIEGQALLVNFSGCTYYRFFTL